MSHQLKQNYPSLIYIESETIPQGYEAFYDEGRIFAIANEDLSENEIFLLKKLFPFAETTPWMSYLLHDGIMHASDEIYHILQIKLATGGDEGDLWLNTFLEFFNRVEDVFSLNETHHVCVIHKKELEDLDLNGILQTLQEDIGVFASLYIGQGNTIGLSLQENFKEDLRMFQTLDAKQRVNNFKDLYLPFYIGTHLQKSAQLKSLRDQIFNLKDGIELVQVLWSCQGNVSQASQLLFLHRNTLNYRLDKFEEQTGLSLRTLGDLQLAYFSII